MNTDHDFSQALSWLIVNKERISLTLNGKERTYYWDTDKIICIPNGRDDLSYVVKDFKIDAVLSDKWQLLCTSKEQ